MIACPCALGLATPDGDHGGHRRRGAARHPDQGCAGAGDRAQRSTRVAFDKTGTLTEGKPRLVAFERRAGRRTRLLALGARRSCKRQRASAGARRGRAAAESRAWRSLQPASVRAVAGPRHAKARWAARAALRQRAADGGARRVARRAGAARRSACRARARPCRGWSQRDRGPDAAGLLAFGDAREAGAREARRPALRARGVRLVMLTGDNARQRRERWRQALGIDEVHGRGAARRTRRRTWPR